ncbi:hypothetical protein AVEN_182103-1 [Araneus ventricosus]|uniref:Uncharacterized protein n=1 Tax=Araneus ventricosus TaxID=182803 RepID=A0A4Y1ZKJ4_ARAVE|nr:hypothetical protein AVEN_48064-1 [Araneus ventricosus]GBN07370.1 hypothetical protein AVEN_182103-1 [Araneus ventricosus]
MDVCPQNSFGAHPWQAALPSIMIELKDEFELANSTNALCHQPVRKKLTTEALFMLDLEKTPAPLRSIFCRQCRQISLQVTKFVAKVRDPDVAAAGHPL